MNIIKTGYFIKMLRTEQGLTQKELAEKLGCTDKAVSRWETGTGLPDASLLLPLSAVLCVSVNELLSGERLIIVDKNQANTSDDITNADDNTLTVSELIDKTDETIVGLMQDKNNEIKKLKKSTVLLFILCGMQVIIFFGLPGFCNMLFPRFDSAGLLVFATIANSLLVGLLNGKMKWIYPVFVALLLLFVMPFAGNEAFKYGIFSLYFLIGAAVFIAIGSLMKFGITKIIRAMKEPPIQR